MIKVYQIQLSDLEIQLANSGASTPKLRAFYDKSFGALFKAENFVHYTHVANVYTNDIELAFKIMNLWEDVDINMVELLGPCSSMSVGDILEDHNGDLYRCASFGFTKISG